MSADKGNTPHGRIFVGTSGRGASMQPNNSHTRTVDYSDIFVENVRYFNLLYRKAILNAPLCANRFRYDKRNNVPVTVTSALKRTFSDFEKAVVQHGE